jgi:acetyl-CoA/propionyl-CoA carboxylase carboxyl transferase subunit
MSEAAIDPRDPQLRIERILDSGTIKLLSERDKSGMLAAHGSVDGVATGATFTAPFGVAADPNGGGRVIIVDTGGSRVRARENARAARSPSLLTHRSGGPWWWTCQSPRGQSPPG